MIDTILVTGSAGFIGFHVAQQLLSDGWRVVGLDNFNDYYDVTLKEARTSILKRFPNFFLVSANLEDNKAVHDLFKKYQFKYVINLAAQAGMHYSLTNPYAYIDANITGFLNILESCRQHKIEHLIYASSSSVYGLNSLMPFSTHQSVNHPLSLYAASKKSNELMAHTYSHLYQIPMTGLRFFSVYGPWGRPDMALFIFTKAILAGQPIKIYNNGQMQRDFTYIDDIVKAVTTIMHHPAEPNKNWSGKNPDPATSSAPYKIYNVGNHTPINLLDFLHIIEKILKKKAIIKLYPMQPGDIMATCAEIDDLKQTINFSPDTPIEKGIAQFIQWYQDYYHEK